MVSKHGTSINIFSMYEHSWADKWRILLDLGDNAFPYGCGAEISDCIQKPNDVQNDRRENLGVQ